MKTRGTTRGRMTVFGLEVMVVFDSEHQPLSPWFNLIKIARGMERYCYK